MDHFGIGCAMRGMVMTYFQAARSTGRTASLVESVKDGDRICFTNSREAERVRRLCKERGVDVECITLSPEDPGQGRILGTPAGRTIFDHSWVEQFYLLAIEQAQRDIDMLERESSGYGEAHRETRRYAEELSKWRT